MESSALPARTSAATFLAAILTVSALHAQTAVPVLVPHTSRHDHYLFNRTFTFDGQDYTGLPWRFYYANAGASPPPTTLRTRCVLETVNGSPYNHANFGWFRFPTPGGDGAWPPADGTEPFAATGEYLATAQFGPTDNTSPAGFAFVGEFAGLASPPSVTTHGFSHYFVEAVYFTDRECSDGGTEYGWYRKIADSAFGDAPVNSFVFYYSTFTNCNLDYACWDVDGHQVKSSVANATLTNVAPNAAGTYQYKFQAIRSGSDFNIAVLDPVTNKPVACQWSLSGGGGSSGPCEFSFPFESWFPAANQIASGYIVVATQSSHLFPNMTGAPYPEWYDFGVGGPGAAPPKNIVPSTEPNGAKSCITNGKGYACLDAASLQVLYE